MRRYFLQIENCEHACDEDGLVFTDQMAVETAVLRTLFDVGRDEAITGRAQSTTITAKDDSGRPVFRATLSLQTEWIAVSGE